MSADGLARVRPAMQAYIDDGRLAGVMTMVARQGQVVHWDAVGLRDLGASDDTLEPDDILRIFSMTKPVTSVSVMILVEEGKAALDDPLSKFVPEFADVTVLMADGDRVAPDGPITIQHLLTHTSGLTYGFSGDSAVDRLYDESRLFAEAQGLEDFASRVADLPLLANPGERWNYSVSTDMLERVVEVASDQTFDEFVRTAHHRAAGDGRHRLPRVGRQARPIHRKLRPAGRHVAAHRLARQRPAHPAAGLAVWRRRAHLDRVGLHPIRADAVARRRAGRRADSRNRHGGDDTDEPPAGVAHPGQLRHVLEPRLRVRSRVRGAGGRHRLAQAGQHGRPPLGGRRQYLLLDRSGFWIDPEAELIGMLWTQISPFAVYDIEREFQTLVYEALQ